jgi:tetratricopeptide (TPR) repeat protein
LVVSAAGASCGGAQGGYDVSPPSAPREASQYEVPVRVLEVSSEYRFDEQGNWSETFRQRYEILTRQGVELWGGTETGWSPWYMARPEIVAEVRDPDGVLRLLDPSTLSEATVNANLPEVYSDHRLLRAPLPAIRVGSVVTETISRRTTRPFFAGGSSFQLAFEVGVPRESVELVIDTPEGMPLNLEVFDAKAEKTESVQNGRRRLVFRGGPYRAIQRLEDYSPPDLARWPSIAFSTGKSWEQIAAAYADVMTDKLRGAALTDLARRSVRQDDPPLVKANKLLTQVRRRVRYAAVQFGHTAIIPSRPEDTLARGYGDCKDQSLLLVGLLRAVGVPATIALLRTGPGQDVHPRLPALDAFDHAIVVTLGDEPIWVDPTAVFARAGELPEADQGRLALVIDDDTVSLTPTPLGSARDNGYLEVREVRLQEYGPAMVTETSTASGILEQRLRSGLSGSREDLTKSFTDYAKNTYNAKKLSDLSYTNVEDLAVPFKLVLEASDAEVGHTDLASASVYASRGGLFGWLPDVLLGDAPRSTDLMLPLRYRAEIRYRFIPPRHFVVHRLPSPPEVNLGPLRLARTYEKQADNHVVASFVLEADQHRLSPDDIAAFRRGMEALNREQDELVEFEHIGQQAVEARQTVKGIGIYRRLAEEDPTSSMALLRYAGTLIDLGFGRDAREKARAALALAPNSAVAHRTLGIILAHDELGRMLVRGYDRDGAIAAHLRAAELDPTDIYSKVYAALLAEYDTAGRRYTNREELLRAVARYDAIPEDELAGFEDGSHRFNAGFAELYAERIPELRRRLAKWNPREAPSMLAIAAAAYDASIITAIAEADRLNLRGEARSEAFAAVAGSLCWLGRYGECADLYEAAAADSGNAASYSNRASLARRMVPVDPQTMLTNTPEELVRKLFAVVGMAERYDEAGIGPMLSSRAAFNAFRGLWTPSPRLGEQLYLRRQTWADTMAGILKLSPEGSDATGYRVAATLAAPGSQPIADHFYVVREQGRYALRAMDNTSDLGCEALHLVRQRNEKAARQWLSWAKDRTTAAAGDDPLRSPPFLLLWADGKGDVELSAAALCAAGHPDATAIELLGKARSRTDIDRVALDHALALAALRANIPEEALHAVERIERVHPKSKTARSLRMDALVQLKRWDAYETVARAGLAEETQPGPERTELFLSLGNAQERAGRIKEALATYQASIDEGQATSSIYNNAAWDALFVEPHPPGMLAHALQAAQLSSFKKYSPLHTLASVYIELGKVEEARQTLAKMLELNPDEEPPVATWYVVGALAEAYGLVDTARSAYLKLGTSRDLPPTATLVLVQKRQAGLARLPAPAAPR